MSVVPVATFLPVPSLFEEVTYVMTQEFWTDPNPCTTESTVCLKGFEIRCIDRYGDDACWTFFGCVTSTGTDCRSPVVPVETTLVPVPAVGGWALSALLLVLILYKAIQCLTIFASLRSSFSSSASAY